MHLLDTTSGQLPMKRPEPATQLVAHLQHRHPFCFSASSSNTTCLPPNRTEKAFFFFSKIKNKKRATERKKLFTPWTMLHSFWEITGHSYIIKSPSLIEITKAHRVLTHWNSSPSQTEETSTKLYPNARVVSSNRMPAPSFNSVGCQLKGAAADEASPLQKIEIKISDYVLAHMSSNCRIMYWYKEI